MGDRQTGSSPSTRLTLKSGDAQRRPQVLRHPVGHPLGDAQTAALLEADVVVDMHHLAGGEGEVKSVSTRGSRGQQTKLRPNLPMLKCFQ